MQRKLVTNHQVKIFRTLRARGHTYPEISALTGWCISTIRHHICRPAKPRPQALQKLYTVRNDIRREAERLGVPVLPLYRAAGVLLPKDTRLEDGQ